MKELEGKIREEQNKVSRTIGGEIIISDEEEDDEDDDDEEVHNLVTETSDNHDLVLRNKSKTSVNENLGVSRQLMTGVGLLKQSNTTVIEKQTR